MAKTVILGITVVAAINGRERQYWVAAVSRDKAVEAVQKKLGPGWKAELAHRNLTPHEAATVKLRAGAVKRLDPDD